MDSLKIKLRNSLKFQKNIEEKVCPEHKSVFLRFSLGKVNVRVWNKKDKEKMKDQYNLFKVRTSIIFIILPLIQLFFDLGSIIRMYLNFNYL